MKSLIDMDAIANNPLKRRRKPTPKCVTEVIRLMDRGEFDETNPTHVHMRNAAIKRKAAPDWGEEENLCQI